MAEPFIAELRTFSFPFAPRGWAFCNGAPLQRTSNQALFALIGTTYGGDDKLGTFNLPNLQDRTPLHRSPRIPIGVSAGENGHVLTTQEIPSHNHGLTAVSDNGTVILPAGNYLAASANQLYQDTTSANLTQLAGGTIGKAGQSQAHNNMQPFVGLNICIALTGIFPSRN